MEIFGQSVKSWGTEGRQEGDQQIPPLDRLHDRVNFRGEDIKDLHVHEVGFVRLLEKKARTSAVRFEPNLSLRDELVEVQFDSILPHSPMAFDLALP